MIAGFLYLICGVLLWIGKIIFFVFIILSINGGSSNFDEPYNNMSVLVFVINLFTIFFRLGSVYIIKLMYKHVCTLEEYMHEKEHAESIQSLGQRNTNEDKLVDDEEITEDQLYKKNQNPFITGRKKDEDNEEEEINF